MSWDIAFTHVNALGESPFWHPLEQCLYWVDILKKQILRGQPHTHHIDIWQLTSEPGCIAPAESGGLVVALRDGIYRAFDWGGELHLLQHFSHGTTTRFNDGKCDPLGRFWAGTVYEPKDQRLAALYSLDARFQTPPLLQQHANNAVTANGLAWSPDARTLYWADTAAHVIYAWDWEAQTNQLQQPRIFQKFPVKSNHVGAHLDAKDGYLGRPDGAAVNALGHYFVAMYEGARILQFAPDGSVLRDIPVPLRCPTMPCFGGADLRTLYITSASQRPQAELDAFPKSGCILEMRVQTPGLPVNFFKDCTENLCTRRSTA